jgi:hypothetical protein
MGNLPKRRRNRKDGCPKPAKRRYRTRRDALNAMSGALCGPTNLYVSVSAYKCRGHWHLAHSTWYGRRP